MHKSAQIKVEFFLKHYRHDFPRSGEITKVLEIGSKSYLEQDTLRPMFPAGTYGYVGLDIEAGPNVDLVPADPYIWHEIADEAFDVCVSSQTFEHNPYFWVTFCEMARVLRQGGYLFISAPGAGKVHRFPYDCWRFYPDAWAALCHMAGIELVETHFEKDHTAAIVPGGSWRDSTVIARKPVLPANDRETFYRRLAAIVAPFAAQTFGQGPAALGPGPCFADYERYVAQTYRLSPLKQVERGLRRYSPPAICS